MRVSRAYVRSRLRTKALALCVACASVAACGKKGPPLAPIARLPAAVERVTATRVGHDVYLTLTIPAANIDGSTPVDLGYVDIYAHTGTTAPPRVGFVEQATRIAQVPVAPAPVAGEPAATPRAGAAAAGATITIVETVPAQASADARRFYLAVPFSTRSRPGRQHTPVEVKLSALPPAPSGVAVNYSESAVTVTWMPSNSPGVTASRVNVYRQTDPVPDATPAIWQVARPLPLNAAPLQAPPFSDAVAFGAEICYILRSVAGEGPAAVESEPSPPACVTPVDRFPPAAPAQLVAVATAGAINLLWEPNAESDLAGYLVLRGAVGDARLQPLTPTPISEVRFADAAIVSGMRYVYAVVAVDRQTPTPNVSPESARVEETAQ